MSTFFYDEQIRRYILQFLRIFSDFSTEAPPDENGIRVQKRVPIRYGDMQRQVAQILKENSENVTLSAPAMSGYITSIDMANDRRNDPMNVTPARAMERVYNKETGLYEATLGNRYTIERYMPVPYTLTMNLDIWTTNTTDKFQLWEQIMAIFNPSVQLQINDNPLDWSAITEIEMTDQNFSSRGVPQGSVSANDFSTFTFKIPIWINPPAKVKRQTIIEQIAISISDLDVNSIDVDRIFDPMGNAFNDLARVIVSPGNYRIDVSAIDSTTSRIELLDEFGQSDSTLSWGSLFAAYGAIDPETTTLTLKTDDDIEDTLGDILGTLEVSDTEQNIATFVVDADTLPTTIGSGAVTDLVNPSVSFPGGTLPAAAVGQRYLLLTNDQDGGGESLIAQDSHGNNPWGGLTAFENDIIEYNGTAWFVSFDAATVTSPQYVVNSRDSQHYKFDGDDWVFTYLATFNPGYWRLITTKALLEPTFIGNIADVDVEIDKAISPIDLSLNFKGDNSSTFTYSFIGTLPNGLFFNSATGVLSGIPTQKGRFLNFQIRASRPTGKSTLSNTFNISIFSITTNGITAIADNGYLVQQDSFHISVKSYS